MEQKRSITYKQSMSSSDLFRYVKAVALPVGVFVLCLITISSLAGFGTKLVAPMTAVMWVVGAICAAIQPSHRANVLSETHVAIAGYLAMLLALKKIIAMMSGVSSEMLMAAFNQAMPVTSGSAISGWLQNLMWITAAMTPIGFVAMQVKRVFSFRKERSTKKAFEGLRGSRSGTDEHLR